jgi:hypothetical protein
MSLPTLTQAALLLAIVAGAAVAYTFLLRLRDWYDRNLDRAPAALQLALLLLLLAGIVLVAADLLPIETVGVAIIGLSVIAALSGWQRYQRSAHLRRWEATYEQVGKLLPSNPDAADHLMMQAIKEDEVELEQLRTAAPNDRRAALDFQRRTQRELRKLADSARAVRRLERDQPSVGQAGSALISRRRQKLEADLEWIRAVLSGPGGAA